MSRADPAVVDAIMALVREALAAVAHRPVIIGLCAAQGAGKTTLASAIVDACRDAGLNGAMLSIDDLYLTRADRRDLAASVHPLLMTRGVPGTHDVPLGLATFAALRRGEPAPLPRFDKATDDRAPRDAWAQAAAGCEVLIFEGWCVGAVPEGHDALADPVNDLEAREDPEAVWRGHVNAALAGRYRDLFGGIDRQVLLAAPGFGVVSAWRLQQERELAASRPDGAQVMDDAAVERFIAHYERLTRHILREMPHRADLLVELDAGRRPIRVCRQPAGHRRGA